ncbi:hypothetical protein F4680DRAFT_440407 [Xylaria scruposa]|nr:hypothetical protein F4680DRAFT_440407 [Xylaria scruposa]
MSTKCRYSLSMSSMKHRELVNPFLLPLFKMASFTHVRPGKPYQETISPCADSRVVSILVMRKSDVRFKLSSLVLRISMFQLILFPLLFRFREWNKPWYSLPKMLQPWNLMARELAKTMTRKYHRQSSGNLPPPSNSAGSNGSWHFRGHMSQATLLSTAKMLMAPFHRYLIVANSWNGAIRTAYWLSADRAGQANRLLHTTLFTPWGPGGRKKEVLPSHGNVS